MYIFKTNYFLNKKILFSSLTFRHMKKCYLLLIITFLLADNSAIAQMVGANVFLPGRYLEIGIARNGSWGPAAPAGYYPCPATGSAHPTAGGNLMEVYDYGHDGWTVGAPQYYGDYTYPGTPFQGWSMQVNGTRADAFYTTGGGVGASFTGGLTGSNTSYTNAGGRLSGVWQGTCGGLNVTQTNRIDTQASWVVVTTVFANPTGAAIPGVYYWATCDPDDDVVTSGNYTTNNYNAFQNDVDHRVLAASTGSTNTNTYLAIGTKDCRAKAMMAHTPELTAIQ